MPRPSLSPVPAAALRKIPPLWMLIVAQLDTTAFDYCPSDIAPLLQIAEHSLRNHCRELWPNRESRRGRWRLDFDDASVLIRRACIDPKNLRDHAALYDALRAAGKVDDNLAETSLIRRALHAISLDHAERKHALRIAMRHTPPTATPSLRVA